jgi:serine protease AprX
MNKCTRFFQICVMLALLLGALWPIATSGQTFQVKAHPILAQIADQSPMRLVSVIVQKAGSTGHAEADAIRLGAKITRDLRIINAFTAQMMAKSAVELANSPSVRWVSLDAPVRQSDAEDTVYTTWATSLGSLVANGFANNTSIVDDALGPNGLFGYGSSTRGSFAGFVSEVTPDYSIHKIEVVLQAYVPFGLGVGEDPLLTLYVGGKPVSSLTLSRQLFAAYTSPETAGQVEVDITGSHIWQWTDFDSNVELVIDQSRLNAGHPVYYDAIGLRVTSGPGAVNSGNLVNTTTSISTSTTSSQTTSFSQNSSFSTYVITTSSSGNTTTLITNSSPAPIDISRLATVYNQAVRAPEVWNEAPAYLQGQGVTVAVVDSGVVKNKNLNERLLTSVNFNKSYHDSADRYGHGTFVSSIIAGNGKPSFGKYIGIAPKTNLINLRVSDDTGAAEESDVINALQWALENKSRYNIRVINLSLNSSMPQSYHTSPLDAAVEILWFNGIVVVTSVGNNGSADLFPPANDPFVITVGATNDMGTVDLSDDVVAPFSAYGVTELGGTKPELVAPGKDIVAYLPGNYRLTLGLQHPANRVWLNFFRMSGTSFAAPMVSGAVAILLQQEPALTPDQVKNRLMVTANKAWPGYDPQKAGAGYLDIYSAVHNSAMDSANTSLVASQMLWTGSQPITWESVSWNSVSWNSVSWNSVSWNSVSWNSVSWNSDYWEQ